jgi:hypothetical protein
MIFSSLILSLLVVISAQASSDCLKMALQQYAQEAESSGNWLKYYSRHSYELNKELLKKRPAKEQLEVVAKINASLAKLPPMKMTSYHGTAWRKSDWREQELAVGKDFSFKTFLSTTTKPKVAQNFALDKIPMGYGPPNERIKMIFTVEGKSGRDISKFSAWKSEREILFAPGIRFQVRSIKHTEIQGEDIVEVGLREI